MKVALAGFLIMIPALSWADFNSNARGTTTADFLKLGVGARAEAMGEAYSAVADDATALYWNPAGLARIEENSVSLMHAPYLASTFYDYGAYAHRWGNHTLGAGIQYFSAGSIAETDENNAPLGSYSPYDLAFSLGYAYRLSDDGYAIGIDGKFVRSTIIDSASTFATDFGLQTRPYWDRLRLAFAVANLGGTMKFEQESDPLPLALRYGAAFSISEHWLASWDIIIPRDNSPYTALGAEYSWRVTSGLSLAGRLGYNSLTSGDISGFTGLAFGFGLGWQKVSFDYAFLPYGGLGLTQRISLNFKWGGAENEKTLRRSSADEDIKYPSQDHDELP